MRTRSLRQGMITLPFSINAIPSPSTTPLHQPIFIPTLTQAKPFTTPSSQILHRTSPLNVHQILPRGRNRNHNQSHKRNKFTIITPLTQHAFPPLNLHPPPLLPPLLPPRRPRSRPRRSYRGDTCTSGVSAAVVCSEMILVSVHTLIVLLPGTSELRRALVLGFGGR